MASGLACRNVIGARVAFLLFWVAIIWAQQARLGRMALRYASRRGYESGTDPYTGRRVHGTYTAAQVGVGGSNNPGPPRYPSPGGYPQDRALLEGQLWDKSLPEGEVQRPTAGYLYFPASLLKKKSNDVYELQYLGPQDRPQLANAPAKVELRVPAKAR
jgi:hypothetical protein